MKITTLLFLTMLATPALADECTKKLISYQEGLAVMSVAAGSAEARDKAAKEIRAIDKKRKSMSDCEVVKTVPALVKTDKAIKAGDATGK